MSMIGNLRAVDDATLQALLASPDTIQEFLYPDDGEDDAAEQNDLDKAWHAIHFILTGSAWEGEFPLNFLVSGGTPVGDEDVGYGPARAFTSEEVWQIEAALSRVSETDFRGRFSLVKMREADIYPSFGDASDDEMEAELSYVLENFRSLKEFVARSAGQGRALLVYIN